MKTFFLLPLVLLALSLGQTASGLGLTCSEHPGYSSGLVSTLPRSWEVLSGSKSTRGNYHVNPPSHSYAPKDDLNSTKYDGLDLFWSYQDGEGPEYIRLQFQRAAKVYLLVQYDSDDDYPAGELEGWKAEEYVELVKGYGDRLVYGVHQKDEKYVPGRAYAFSKVVESEVILPSGEWIQENTRGLSADPDWVVLVAEEDGSAPRVPKSPSAVSEEIKPNERCPDELHDLWVTANTDDNDPDTEGMKWPTWHPMWDPCFWCAYDHEHGSSPKHLMGYEPKFGYVAWKNGRETEIHEGFKGVCFQQDDVMVYYMMHGQTSNVRRLGIRFHSISLVVSDAETKEILMEVGHKGDFGFISGRSVGGFTPLTADDEVLEAELEAEDFSALRSVNVINMEGTLDDRFEFMEDRNNIRRGRYEEWKTTPICSVPGNHGALVLDFTQPITGIQFADDLTSEIALGFDDEDGFFKNNGLGRIMRANEFNFSEQRCMFHLEDIEGGSSTSDGEFYTDARGKKLVKGPGPNAVRQFITTGFSLSLDGDYEAVESWTGLFVKDIDGRMFDYGYGLDPAVN